MLKVIPKAWWSRFNDLFSARRWARFTASSAERSAADFMKEYYTLYAFSVKWRANNLTSRGASRGA
jgi:hypothetical protein